ncbi:PRC-barrel domain-containing protein [Nonomuraea aurantiaca]|uniref:PRC-barrel domain-containing protein n=1 Tax=Nonomuraea aurantiaca TaxID=2878562 RepID=UPI001CD96983|nr:PRC-barrel domain-containing protein [Nonomuraea aurantiaca]MCA2224101.1 PRC-barrel domain-containing protein [Nonomuraea aurantiaca]
MQTEIRSLLGSRVIGADGEEIGKVGQVYLSDSTGEPEWVTVRTGLFGVKQTFVPLMNARRSGEEIRVPFDKDTIKDAPNIDLDGRLSLEEEARLYRHYGIRPTGVPSQRTAVEPGTGLSGHETHDEDEGEGEGEDTAGTRTARVHIYKYVEVEVTEETVPLEEDETVTSPVDYLRSLRGKKRPEETGPDRRERIEAERIEAERREPERMPLDSGDYMNEHDEDVPPP